MSGLAIAVLAAVALVVWGVVHTQLSWEGCYRGRVCHLVLLPVGGMASWPLSCQNAFVDVIRARLTACGAELKVYHRADEVSARKTDRVFRVHMYSKQVGNAKRYSLKARVILSSSVPHAVDCDYDMRAVISAGKELDSKDQMYRLATDFLAEVAGLKDRPYG